MLYCVVIDKIHSLFQEELITSKTVLLELKSLTNNVIKELGSLKANIAYALDNEETKKEIKEYLKEIL